MIKALLRPIYGRIFNSKPLRERRERRATDYPSVVFREFIHGDSGKNYGLTADDKRVLVDQFRQSVARIQAGTSALTHVILAREILAIPPDVKGDLIECGAWKGASSASLSLVARRTGRKLLVCDSFAGLPDDGMQLHVGIHNKSYGYYQKGMFCGRLDEVQENITLLGDIGVCEFVQGYFCDSLQALRDPIAFAFLDVDLVGSTQDCLKAIWPLLIEQGACYTDDSADLDVVRIFFDDAWWQANFGCRSPAYVGSGCGLSPDLISVGYTRKLARFDPRGFNRASWLYYPDDKS